jgi:hypothetical protein
MDGLHELWPLGGLWRGQQRRRQRRIHANSCGHYDSDYHYNDDPHHDIHHHPRRRRNIPNR